MSEHPNDPAAIVRRTTIDPSRLSPGETLQLQQTIGNRAVDHLVGSIKSTSGQIIQREWNPEKCPAGCPPATLTPEKVLAQVLTSEPLFTQGATKKGKKARWIYTFYSAYQVKVDGWIISALVHAHVTPKRQMVPGNIYIPGYNDWDTETTETLLEKFPIYDATVHKDKWTDDAAANKNFFSGSNRYPHKEAED